ncbi:hypothetical protein [Microvirga arabica]|uniref:hypothetical protein n=1 Tax=Microvirga arabica TaxID=1128671 RepID=UPI00193928D2|nr:hypothetical protein [Microvirga arabica]MBM1172853.1 hypothetical protein [Microvirga arabica]
MGFVIFLIAMTFGFGVGYFLWGLPTWARWAGVLPVLIGFVVLGLFVTAYTGVGSNFASGGMAVGMMLGIRTRRKDDVSKRFLAKPFKL